tara:strand:- start:7889 stop:8086 length:198 start_codon:yes stop_codon:yes gene_type:complete
MKGVGQLTSFFYYLNMELKMNCNMEEYKKLLTYILLKDLTEEEKKEIEKSIDYILNTKQQKNTNK